MNQLQKAERLKALHERDELFVIPNPWDAGSAKLLARMESRSPGWVGKLLTHRVSGLNAQALQNELNAPRDINRIKTFVALGG